MLECKAGGLTRAHVEVWLGQIGTGFLDLFQKKNNEVVHLAGNPSAGDTLRFALPPEPGVVRLGLRVINADIAGQARPVFLEIKQDGQTLQIVESDGGQSQNGSNPFTELQLIPNAPHNEPKFYYFNVRFA